MSEVEYPSVGYGVAVALDEGTGSFNYAVLKEGGEGQPVVLAAEGLDDNIDVEILPKGTGSVIINGDLEFDTLTVSQSLNVGDVTSIPAAPRMFTLYKDRTASGTGGQAFRLGGILRGTLSANLEGYYAQVLDEDRLQFSNTNNGMLVNYTSSTLRGTWSGARTVQTSFLYVGDPTNPGSVNGTSGSNAYLVSGQSFAYSYGGAGGVIGAHRGNLFGRNDATRVRSGSGQYWNSTFGTEIDVGVATGNLVLWKGGTKVVKWSDDAVPGLIQDYAYGVNDQSGATGWRVGFQLGGFEGVWPFRNYSQIMSFFPSNLGGPAVESGTGINFLGITFSRSAFESAGFRVGPTGNVGALVASGGTIQTRGTIRARTAVVNTITVLEGGLFVGALTLTCSASPGGGTTATATAATYAIPFFSQVAVPGTGYVVGDTITLTGGTFSTACSGTVSKVDGAGGVQGVTITEEGDYSVPPVGASATSTSGAGTGCTLVPHLKLLTVTVTNAGTLYDEHLPPTITGAAATTMIRQPLFAVTMTATQTDLSLNPGGSVVIGTQTPASASATGTAGTVTWDSDYVYVCTATNTWKRAALSTW